MAQEETANPAAAAPDDKKGGRGQRGSGGGGRGGQQRESRSKLYEEEVVRINRCDKVVKGGKRSSFSAFVVLGDGKGKVGYGYAKARQVPNSIDKAVRAGEKAMQRFPIVKDTIPHEVEGRFGSAVVRLIPAAEGTGVIAGKTVRAVLEKLGIHNVLTKSFGSNNPINLVKATFDALEQLRTKEQYEELRGIKL